MLTLEMKGDLIIPITFSLYWFHKGDVHMSFILFKGEKQQIKVYRCFGKCPSCTLFKTSGFGCTVNFDFASSCLRCLVDDFKCNVRGSKIKTD